MQPLTEQRSPGEVTLDYLFGALGSTVVSLQVAPSGTQLPIGSVTLLDAEDLIAAEPDVPVADLCILAGVPASVALSWLARSTFEDPAHRPVALVTKDASPELCAAAGVAGIALGALHLQARAEMVLSTVRSLLDGAAARRRREAVGGGPFAEETDLYGLAQRVAALTGGLVTIEDDRSRLLAYSATDGAADELRMLSILGREGPSEHLRRLRELGVFDRLRQGSSVIEVPADEKLGWRRRLVVSIEPLTGRPGGRGGVGASSLGTIWIQEGFRPLEPDAESVLQGAAAIAARLIHRARSAPTQEALQIQRLLGIRGGGVDVPSLASALALPTSGPAAVVGIGLSDPTVPLPAMTELGSALRLLAGAYARDSLVTTTDERLYVLIPRLRAAGLTAWTGSILDRLTARFGPVLRAAIAAPIDSLTEVPAARTEVDRVLDRPAGIERVTTLTRSRTPVLLGEIAELIGSHEELRDPRLQTLIDYDHDHGAELVPTLEQFLQHFGDVRSAATVLHVHPNTLRYRVRRAEQILGMSLDEPDARLLLQIQLLTHRRRR